MVMVDGYISFVLAVVSLIDVLLAVVLSWLFQRKVFFEACLVVSHARNLKLGNRTTN